MTIQRKWLVMIGVIVTAVAAWALGVSLNTLVLLGAVLLCPAAMYFGMSGTGQGCGHSEKCDHSNASDQELKTEGHERQKAA